MCVRRRLCVCAFDRSPAPSTFLFPLPLSPIPLHHLSPFKSHVILFRSSTSSYMLHLIRIYICVPYHWFRIRCMKLNRGSRDRPIAIPEASDREMASRERRCFLTLLHLSGYKCRFPWFATLYETRADALFDFCFIGQNFSDEFTPKTSFPLSSQNTTGI